jgi:hypothetical protein
MGYEADPPQPFLSRDDESRVTSTDRNSSWDGQPLCTVHRIASLPKRVQRCACNVARLVMAHAREPLGCCRTFRVEFRHL